MKLDNEYIDSTYIVEAENNLHIVSVPIMPITYYNQLLKV